MRKYLAVIMAVMCGAVISATSATVAQAQASRTWVSGVGDDVNPCSRTAPCKTFAGAISKTAAGGEINVLDPGGFGAVTITKSMTIRAVGALAGVIVAGTNGIVINLPSATDKVVLDGLDLDGFGSGLSGVNIISAGNITIRDCAIRNFTTGISVTATLPARVVLDNVQVINNSTYGLDMDGPGGVAHSAIMRNSVVDKNGTAATRVNGPATLVLTGSMLTGSPSSIIATAGGAVQSYGNNVLRNAGAPTSTVPLQ